MIINTLQAIKLSARLHKQNKKIVVAGGCFDILHNGHKKFLKESSLLGDFLLILLESDKNITNKKGVNRPINKQSKRARNLSFLPYVDYILTLPEMTKDSDYDTLLSQLNPEVITATKGDKELKHKKRQSKKLKAKLVLINKLGNISTSKILEKYGNTRNNTI